jgi:hypothetical protein
MVWITILFCVALLVVLTRKTVDRETTKNLKFFSKLLAAIVIFIVLIVFLTFIGH